MLLTINKVGHTYKIKTLPSIVLSEKWSFIYLKHQTSKKENYFSFLFALANASVI